MTAKAEAEEDMPSLQNCSPKQTFSNTQPSDNSYVFWLVHVPCIGFIVEFL